MREQYSDAAEATEASTIRRAERVPDTRATRHSVANQTTLFQVLARQPWWISILVAFGMFWIAYAVYPPVAPFFALPFAILAIYIGIRQWRSGVPSNPGEQLEALRNMSWETFSAAVSEAYRREGYAVSPSRERGYDFTLTREGRLTLLHCRRWKVNQVGAEPVRELARAVDRMQAHRGICLATGEFSAPARKLAAAEPVALVSGTELVMLVNRGKKHSRWFRR
jgi:restriction system protein